MNRELEALEIASKEIEKIMEKYNAKDQKEKAKANDVHITIRGEKFYTENEIMEAYASDWFSSSQADKYIEKLEKKKEAAGLEKGFTKSGYVQLILSNLNNSLKIEIDEIQLKEQREKDKQERWEIYHKYHPNDSYADWLQREEDAEEVTRRSEEHEALMP